jgi:hypothetical protein
VFEDTLAVVGKLKSGDERALLLNPLISPSTVDAAARRLSLTLVRPSQSRFYFRKKPTEIIEAEREGYKRAVDVPSSSILERKCESVRRWFESVEVFVQE